jgi:hypothetical protein
MTFDFLCQSGYHPSRAMPLHVYQSLWGMEQLPFRGEREWTLDEQLDLIANAGFDGVSLSFTDAASAETRCRAAIARGLRIQAMYFPTSIDGLRVVFDTIDTVGREHVDHLDLQPDVRPHTLDACIPYLHGWQSLADDAAIPMYVETHRDRMTTDLLFTLRLLEAVPSLLLTADLSHFLVGREFAMPVDDHNHELMHRILRRSRAYHGRVGSREQVQIQTSFPHHRVWVDLFAGWWLEGFRYFVSTHGEEETLTFTCELGPPWYAITGPDGSELSDRWEEALAMADLARSLWNQACAHRESPTTISSIRAPDDNDSR